MIAIVVGHNPTEKGAYSRVLDTYEYDYFSKVTDELSKINSNVEVFKREFCNSYSQEMSKVVHSLNSKDYDYIIELHFNSVSDSLVQGCEALAHKSSIKGQTLANNLLKAISEVYSIRNRGIIKISRANQIGGFGICHTKAPYILLEPFFANAKSTEQFIDYKAFARFLNDFIEGGVI